MDRSFLHGRKAPTRETMVGAAQRISAIAESTKNAADKIVKELSANNDASAVGTTSNVHSEDNVMRLDTVNKNIKTLDGLLEVLLGEVKEPVSAAS